MAPRLLGIVALLLVLVLGGCTYSRQEPGLFRPRSPSPTLPFPSSPSGEVPPARGLPDEGPRINPNLPVAGETVWTSGEGVGLSVRFAVHAVRRIPGATVLDYSVTPLSAPGLRPGAELTDRVDLGLSRSEGNGVAVWLLDPVGRRVYRSVAQRSRQEFHHCLCTPLWVAQPRFRVGRTSLLQLTFPALPSRLDRVDVLLANQVPVTGVPVTAVGQAPTVRQRVDLTRPMPPVRPGRLRTVGLSGLGSAVQVRIGLDKILTAPGVTVLRWRIQAPAGLDYRRYVLGPPVSAPLPETVPVAALNSADGPTLRPPGRRTPLWASWTTQDLNGRPGFECLCSQLDIWARSLSRPGGTVQLTTLFPGLPAGTTRLRVAVPGLAPLSLPVTRLPVAADRLGPPAATAKSSWVYSPDAPPLPWTVNQWPTPLPDEWQLPDYRGTTERIRPLPSG